MRMININDVASYFDISLITVKRRIILQDIVLINEEFINEELFDKWVEEKKNAIRLEEVFNMAYEAYEINGKVPKQTYVYLYALVKGYNYAGARVYINPVWSKEKTGVVWVNKNDAFKIINLVAEYIIFSNWTHDKILIYLTEYIRQNCADIKETIQSITEYIKNDESLKVDNSVIELVNYLRFNLKQNFSQMSYDDRVNFLKSAEEELGRMTIKFLISYLNYIKKDDDRKVIVFNKHQNDKSKAVVPYDQETYFTIAYMVFNKDYWKDNNMVEKAVESSSLAKVWLYHAMHYICAWRSIDIRTKLPRIDITEKPQDILSKIKMEKYTDQEYALIAEKSLFQFEYRSWNKKPQKIHKNHSAQPLRIQISESIKPVIGMLILLCEAHNKLNNNKESLCNMRNPEGKEGKKLFGDLYEKILDGGVFSNRRANKNYMNLLSENTEDEEIDGYLIAAYARSHTGSVDSIPKVTERYLSAKMDGYSPNEIVRCLFERGVCSFVPYLLCDTLIGKEFKQKRIEEQTELIKSIGLTPASIENVIELDDRLEKICNDQINKIIKYCDGQNIETVIRLILENIIKGNALGKDDGMYCLAKACGKRCVNPQKENCIGCGYEMYSKTLFVILSSEILKNEQFFDNAKTQAEKIKRKALLDNKLYPAAYEMLSTLKNIYKIDISEYKKIITRSDEYGLIG